jgi:hypothetical protein
VMIFLFASAYVVSGPIGELVGKIRHRREKSPESEKRADGHDAYRENPR